MLRLYLILFLACCVGPCWVRAEDTRVRLPVEENLFYFAEQLKFKELVAYLEKLPKGSPYPKILGPTAGRLVRAKQALIQAIQDGKLNVTLLAVHPAARKDGKIVGASASMLKVQGERRIRRVIWGGLPPVTTYNLMEVLRAQTKPAEFVSRVELAEALGLVDVLENLVAARAEALRQAHELRKELISGHGEWVLPKAQTEALQESPSPWVAVVRIWCARLREAQRAFKKRRVEAAKALTKGATLLFYQDFNAGMELLGPAWLRGFTAPPPEVDRKNNPWCRKSVFLGTGFDWGEMLDEYHADAVPGNQGKPLCHLKADTCLECRVYPKNVRKILVALNSAPHERGDHYSIISVNVPPGEWSKIRIRLGDLSRHKGFRGFPIMALGDPVWRLVFTARRANRKKDKGYFYLDDLRIFEDPNSVQPEKPAKPPPPPPDEDF